MEFLKGLKDIFVDCFSILGYTVVDAFDDCIESRQPCLYEDSYCESCEGLVECCVKGKACIQEEE